MSKIEGESCVKIRTNLGTRVLIMTSRTKLRAVLREYKQLKVIWAVFPVHIISCRYISFVFSVQLIKITKPEKNPLQTSDVYRGFLDLGNACLCLIQNWNILKICLNKHCTKLC